MLMHGSCIMDGFQCTVVHANLEIQSKIVPRTFWSGYYFLGFGNRASGF